MATRRPLLHLLTAAAVLLGGASASADGFAPRQCPPGSADPDYCQAPASGGGTAPVAIAPAAPAEPEAGAAEESPPAGLAASAGSSVGVLAVRLVDSARQRLVLRVTARGRRADGRVLRCAARGFTSRITVVADNPVLSVRVFVDGREIRSTTAKRLRALVDVRRLRAGTHRLHVLATDLAGATRRVAATFTVCSARLRALPAAASGDAPRFTG